MSDGLIDQILREWPPGYGGVERVAHELACAWGGTVYSLDAQSLALREADVVEVVYPRKVLRRTWPLARFVIPLPSRELWHLLRSTRPLHGHLPSPGVLLVLLLAKVMRPARKVSAHWHFFLHHEWSIKGVFFSVYQWFALSQMNRLSMVITTSPVLAQSLAQSGCRSGRVHVLPCCLSDEQERNSLMVPLRESGEGDPLRVLFIGRLDSYKRPDWLLHALALLKSPWSLDVVGEGPRRSFFEQLSQYLFNDRQLRSVRFHGRVDEATKQMHLATADVLVLPSDRCNEAFGIVQLEAMASGIPALAFECERSGMAWVCRLPALSWPQTQLTLHEVLERLAADPVLRREMGRQSRDRYLELFSRSIWNKQRNILFP